MQTDKAKVVVRQGGVPWEMAYGALEAVFEDDIRGKRVLVKPNAGRKGPAGGALCTGAEVVRGVVRFARDRGAAQVLVGDGALWGVDVWAAMEEAGISAVCRQEGATCVNLDEAKPLVKEIPGGLMVDKLKFSSLPFEVDLVISVPVIKTHMYTGATLSIKNMKGCLYKLEKTILHRVNKPSPSPAKGRCLDYGIADMSAVLLPDYAVLDGTVCMEGFGPSVGTPVELGLVMASKDPTAADFAALRLMGMDPGLVSHVGLVHERCGTAGPTGYTVDPPDFEKWGHRFKSADLSGLENVRPNIQLTEKGTCSACSAAVMTFVMKMGGYIPEEAQIALVTGKDLSLEDMQGDNTHIVGNCAGQRARALGFEAPFCKGCPPVASAILEFIQKKEE